jgi:hypothetical protein
MDTVIRKILASHSLQYNAVEKSKVGFINEVYLTERYVVKLYAKNNSSGYKKELWFYKNAAPFYAPALIAYGENYIIMERIYGTGLYRLWRDMNDAERKRTVEKIARIISHINSADYSEAKEIFGFSSDFKSHLINYFELLLSEVIKSDGIPRELADEVKSYVNANSIYLDDKNLYLTYTDLHFDNLIMTNDGGLYLIDYEMMKAAPKDFVLDVWQRMLIHPFTYANENDHELTEAKDYIYIMTWLREYAPDIFSHPHVKERVNIYGMRYELDILRNYPMGDLPLERIRKYLKGVDW